ncbi:MAG: LytR/AlgR family response regulator transcription factor [Bacteroidia bacterium]
MIKTIIIDDELSAIGVIESLISEYSDDIKICAKCTSVESAVQAITKYLPDLIFLDVELLDGSGFEVIEQFEHLPGHVVFITAFEHYALKAIKSHAFDYILKPIDPVEFQTMLEHVTFTIKSSSPVIETGGIIRFMLEAMKNKVAIPTRNGFQYIEIPTIQYIQGEGSYAKIFFTHEKEIIVSKIVKDFEAILADRGFLRVHKSYLVNMNQIKELRKDDSGYLILNSGVKIPISHKEREKVLYNLRMFSNVI